jgi:predicted RNase H-like nuclease (RuvC/YqgF family)
MTGTRKLRPHAARWPWLVLALLIAGTAVMHAPAPARAEEDIEAQEKDEDINRAVKSLNKKQREDEKVQSRLKALQQQQQETEFRRRTGDPFKSERSLRHDLRRNEAQQGWQKQEDRRLDYEIRRQQQEIQNQTRDWQRSR